MSLLNSLIQKLKSFVQTIKNKFFKKSRIKDPVVADNDSSCFNKYSEMDSWTRIESDIVIDSFYDDISFEESAIWVLESNGFTADDEFYAKKRLDDIQKTKQFADKCRARREHNVKRRYNHNDNLEKNFDDLSKIFDPWISDPLRWDVDARTDGWTEDITGYSESDFWGWQDASINNTEVRIINTDWNGYSIYFFSMADLAEVYDISMKDGHVVYTSKYSEEEKRSRLNDVPLYRIVASWTKIEDIISEYHISKDYVIRPTWGMFEPGTAIAA